VFAIDVSWNAVQSGMIAQCAQAIKDALYGSKCLLAPGVRVGIITYDRTVSFYNLSSELDQAQMLVVSDIDDVFVPLYEGFLVDPQESRSVIEGLLDALPNMFQTNRTADPVLGALLLAAEQALKQHGGRLIIFHTTLPIRGPGTLKAREEAKLLNTDREQQLLVPQDRFYQDIAEKLVEAAVCTDLFVFPNANVDLATIGKSIRSYTSDDD
jgi:protein transport protein SEC24